MRNTIKRSGRPHPGSAFLRDRRGAVLVEFAFVALPFFALLLAVLQTSLIYFVQESLQTSVEVAARGIITGKTQAADALGTTQGLTSAQLAERFRKAGCASLPGFMSCDRLYADVRSGQNWTDINTSAPVAQLDAAGRLTNVTGYALGQQGAIVMVRLMYLWPVPAGPMLYLNNAGSSQRLIYATSVAKSESYT